MRASARELLVPFFTPLVWCGRDSNPHFERRHSTNSAIRVEMKCSLLWGRQNHIDMLIWLASWVFSFPKLFRDLDLWRKMESDFRVRFGREYKNLFYVWGREGIENFVRRITIWHHKACRLMIWHHKACQVMTNSDLKGQIFLASLTQIVASFSCTPYPACNYSKPVLNGHSKIDKTNILMTNGSLMKV